MDFGELKQKSVNDLREICRGDRLKYKNFSYHTRKSDLITFIIRQNSDTHPPPTPEVISNLYDIFETEEEKDERYTEMYMEKPHDAEIHDLVNSLQSQYSGSNVIFDSHNDPNNDIIYRGNKGKYISQYNSLGENGEMILYHGTNGDNLMSILSDDFRLTSNPVHGSLFGRGIYFTNDIEKAIYYSEKGKTTKYVIVCIVHVGDIVKGNQNMHIHPLMPGNHKRYDTSVDNIRYPKQFIKKKNGTYNILGIITIEDYKPHMTPAPPKTSFKIKNTLYEDIILYWVPDIYVRSLHLIPNNEIDKRCKRLDKIRGCKVDYPQKDGFTISRTQLSFKGHTFICVIRNPSRNIVKIFTSETKNELITL